MSSWVVLHVLFQDAKEFLNRLFQLVFCNAVVTGSGKFQFTLAQVNVFVLVAFEYSYLTFTSLVIVAELCTLLCYEVIVLKFR